MSRAWVEREHGISSGWIRWRRSNGQFGVSCWLDGKRLGHLGGDPNNPERVEFTRVETTHLGPDEESAARLGGCRGVLGEMASIYAAWSKEQLGDR